MLISLDEWNAACEAYNLTKEFSEDLTVAVFQAISGGKRDEEESPNFFNRASLSNYHTILRLCIVELKNYNSIAVFGSQIHLYFKKFNPKRYHTSIVITMHKEKFGN